MATAPLKVSCASCQARFHVAAHLVRGKVVKFRCKRCKGPIEVDGTFLPLHEGNDTAPGMGIPLPHSARPGEAEPLFFGVSSRPSQVDIAPSQVDASQSMRLSISDGWEGALPRAMPLGPDAFGARPQPPPPAEPKSAAPAASKSEDAPHTPRVVLTDRVIRPPPIALAMPATRPSQPAASGDPFRDSSPPTTPRGQQRPAPTAQATSSSAMLPPPPPRRSSAPRTLTPSVLPSWTPVATGSAAAPRGPSTAPPIVVHQSELPEDGWPGRRAGGRQRGLAALMIGAVALGFTVMAWQQFHEPKPEPSAAGRTALESPASEAPADTAMRAPETAARLADTVAVAAASAAAAQPDLGATPPPSTRASRYAGRQGGARGSGRMSQSTRPARAAAATADVSPATDSSSSGSAASAAQAMAEVMRERDFDPATAKTALDEAGHEAAACRSDETAAHFARFAITFAPSGKVSSVDIEGGPLVGTNVGSCMLDAFRSAQVPTFTGAPVTVHKNLAF